MNRTRPEKLPDELVAPMGQLDRVVRSYLEAIKFLITNTARDPSYWDQHLLSYLAQDIFESTISIKALAMEGALSVAKREMRFLLEASVKICFVQQSDYSSSIADKLQKFDAALSSHKISMKNELELKLLPIYLMASFKEELGRLYGLTSGAVHLSPAQILLRIEAVNAGRTVGRESATDIEQLIGIVSRCYACSLVLLFQSVPDHVAGDWLVDGNGSTINWYFMQSRFFAGMDANFDYKHERQGKLREIQALRDANVRF